MGLENFSFRGDGLSVFFIKQRDQALKKYQLKIKLW